MRRGAEVFLGAVPRGDRVNFALPPVVTGGTVCGLSVLVMLASAVPALALTSAQKMETCKFGADDQKLAGKARKSFLSKCMANERPAPRKPAAKPKT